MSRFVFKLLSFVLIVGFLPMAPMSTSACEISALPPIPCSQSRLPEATAMHGCMVANDACIQYEI